MANKDEHIKNKLLDLLSVLQELLDGKASDEIKKSKKDCNSIIDIIGDYDASLKQKWPSRIGTRFSR